MSVSMKKLKKLKIYPHLEEIKNLLKKHFMLIIGAETGVGKSIGIPIKLHQQKVWVSVPTVLAAKGLINGVNFFTDKKKNFVGLGVQGQSLYNQKTNIVYMTIRHMINNIISCKNSLKELNKKLPKVIIIDEVHSPNAEMWSLLCLLRKIFTEHPNLKKEKNVIITSATIDESSIDDLFKTFNPYKLMITVPRQYNTKINSVVVEGGYKEFEKKLFLDMKKHLETANNLCELNRKKYNKPISNILIIVPGKDQIDKICDFIEEKCDKKWNPIPVYGNMPQEDMDTVFEKTEYTVIVATNIAESSVTFDVCYVIDLAHHKELKPLDNGQVALSMCLVSQDCLKQRWGRTGRVCDGEVVQYIPPKHKEILSKHRINDFFKIFELQCDLVLTLYGSRIGYNPEEVYQYKKHKMLKGKYSNVLKELLKYEMLNINKNKFEVTDLGYRISKIPCNIKNSFLIVEAEELYNNKLMTINTFIIFILFISMLEIGSITHIWWIDRQILKKSKKEPDVLFEYYEDYFYQYLGDDCLETYLNLFHDIIKNENDVKISHQQLETRNTWNIHKRCFVSKINTQIFIKVLMTFRQIINSLFNENLNSIKSIEDYLIKYFIIPEIEINLIRELLIKVNQDSVFELNKKSNLKRIFYKDDKNQNWMIDKKRTFSKLFFVGHFKYLPKTVLCLNRFTYHNTENNSIINLASVFVKL